MIQAQDVLGLGSEARMNIPGRATGSWRWRMAPGALTAEHAPRGCGAATEAGAAGAPLDVTRECGSLPRPLGIAACLP